MGSKTKEMIEKSFKEALKPRLDFKPISIPTKVSLDGQLNKTLTDSGSLVPMEVKSENGWLVVNTGFCAENMPPLGIGLGTMYYQSRPGAPITPSLRVSSVLSNSPAALQGFQPGDRIDTFGVPGGRAETMLGDPKPFLDFIKDRAQDPVVENRVIEITGQGSQGPFKRKIALCPSGIQHRAEAAKVLAKAD
jgi:hypothetical protein